MDRHLPQVSSMSSGVTASGIPSEEGDMVKQAVVRIDTFVKWVCGQLHVYLYSVTYLMCVWVCGCVCISYVFVYMFDSDGYILKCTPIGHMWNFTCIIDVMQAYSFHNSHKVEVSLLDVTVSAVKSKINSILLNSTEHTTHLLFSICTVYVYNIMWVCACVYVCIYDILHYCIVCFIFGGSPCLLPLPVYPTL